MTLADFLKEYRKRMQISQRTLAQRCGVSHSYIGFKRPRVQISPPRRLKPLKYKASWVFLIFQMLPKIV